MENKILQGDSLNVLKTLPIESVDCIITSPPYWALRDYGVEGQLGLEGTFQEYISKLCDIFDEAKRVLKKTGTCWVNLGDTYGGGGSQDNPSARNYKGKLNKKKANITRKILRATDNSRMNPSATTERLKSGSSEKSLSQIPGRFSIEMANRGWILRNEIIWHKPVVMPSSATDRFTIDFEKIFFFVKSKKYAFEQQKEPLAESSMNDKRRGRIPCADDAKWNGYQNQTISKIKSFAYIEEGGRNKRCVWKISTRPFAEAHFATFPEQLVEPMILAGCPKGGLVLDPFMGAGTTGLVAKKLGRNYVGIELNPKYIEIAETRISSQTAPMF